MYGTYWQLKMLLLRSWRWQTTLDCKKLSSPDTLWVLLTGFPYMTLSMALEPMVLGLPDLSWLSRFLQPKQNFSSHLVSLLWSTVSPFAPQMFLVASSMIWPSLNSGSISSWFKLCYMLICVASKLYTWRSNVRCINYHNTTNHSKYFFSHMIYVLQTSIYQNMGKLLSHPSLFLG